ncbi:alpha/beta hydrolase [Vagococcus elongatus]|uniref:Phospholipase/carboxylesterase/thioesterase domain-containing protein n=1 Tax=Vagococcus elongatus TaxID=180344 RepID=A0A430B465_9ENTE|nr:alpha/beta hydrolase [Vagococcus elongatus]RSU15103.1 hypothetical protein CBF29_01870 [Vagococcus elongatus]
MEHIFIKKASDQPVLVLLHGTGGDEHSLVQIAEHLLPEASILSLRGRVSENGMNRFFKRRAEGDFDLASLEEETDYLHGEIKTLAQEYSLEISKMILLGYSNGANIGAHLLLTRETPLKFGLFFHVMSLRELEKVQANEHQRVWLSHGTMDPLVTEENYSLLLDYFRSGGSQVTDFSLPVGHGLHSKEIESAQKWLNSLEG